MKKGFGTRKSHQEAKQKMFIFHFFFVLLTTQAQQQKHKAHQSTPLKIDRYDAPLSLRASSKNDGTVEKVKPLHSNFAKEDDIATLGKEHRRKKPDSSGGHMKSNSKTRNNSKNKKKGNSKMMPKKKTCHDFTINNRKSLINRIDKLHKCAECSISPSYWLYESKRFGSKKFGCYQKNFTSGNAPIIIDEFCQSLLLPSVSRKHAGNYTCVSPGNYKIKFVLRIVKRNLEKPTLFRNSSQKAETSNTLNFYISPMAEARTADIACNFTSDDNIKENNFIVNRINWHEEFISAEEKATVFCGWFLNPYPVVDGNFHCRATNKHGSTTVSWPYNFEDGLDFRFTSQHVSYALTIIALTFTILLGLLILRWRYKYTRIYVKFFARFDIFFSPAKYRERKNELYNGDFDHNYSLIEEFIKDKDNKIVKPALEGGQQDETVEFLEAITDIDLKGMKDQNDIIEKRLTVGSQMSCPRPTTTSFAKEIAEELHDVAATAPPMSNNKVTFIEKNENDTSTEIEPEQTTTVTDSGQHSHSENTNSSSSTKSAEKIDPTPKIINVSTIIKNATINFDDVELINIIGSGNFSNVYKGRYKNNTNIAVKVPKFCKNTENLDIENVKYELGLLKEMQKFTERVANRCVESRDVSENHRNSEVDQVDPLRMKIFQAHVIKFYGFSVDAHSGDLLLILEHATDGNLYNYLIYLKSIKNYDGFIVKSKYSLLSKNVYLTLLKFCNDCCKGLAYVHNTNILYCDLSSKNILLKNGRCKISDYSLARSIYFGNSEKAFSRAKNRGSGLVGGIDNLSKSLSMRVQQSDYLCEVDPDDDRTSDTSSCTEISSQKTIMNEKGFDFDPDRHDPDRGFQTDDTFNLTCSDYKEHILTTKLDKNPEDEIFPWRFLSPESILQNKFTKKSDIYSLCILFHEIYTLGDLPLKSYDFDEYFSILKVFCREGGIGGLVADSSKSLFKRPEFMTDCLWEICGEGWRLDGEKRPDAYDLEERINSDYLNEDSGRNVVEDMFRDRERQVGMRTRI